MTGAWLKIGGRNCPLPAEAWDRHDEPRRHRLAVFRRFYAHGPAARTVADRTEQEISLSHRYADLRRNELCALGLAAQYAREGSAASWRDPSVLPDDSGIHGSKASHAYVDQASFLGEGRVLAPMGAADPGSFGIPAVLIAELPLQH